MPRGGRRPGAGRPRKTPLPTAGNPPLLLDLTADDPLEFLQLLMACTDAPMPMRVDAAKALLPYQHPKMGEYSKKDEAARVASAASRGKFAPSRAPHLLVGDFRGKNDPED